MGLQIRLFGAVELTVDGRRIAVESGRVESLLTYLLLHRDAPVLRQQLAYLLWPETTDAQARTNLRHVLHSLKRALPQLHRLLDVTPRTLQWSPPGDWWLDVASFDDFVAEADRDHPMPVASLEQAAGLYRGELVPGCYDDWLLAERESRAAQHRSVLRRLAENAERTNDVTNAVAFAERLLIDDPVDEGAARLLMRAHDAGGERLRAVRVYHGLVSALERELGVTPGATTRQQYETLLSTDDDPASAQTLDNVPFVGRQPERAQLASQWRAVAETGSALVLISGEAGVGKTRLADEFRRWCGQRGALTAQSRCYALEGRLAYAPLVDWLRSAALRPMLRRLPPATLRDLARLVPDVLAERADLRQPSPLPQDQQRAALFGAAATALRAAGRPVVLLLDDAQWADRETLQFLHYFLRSATTDPVLVVATARLEDLDGRSTLGQLVASVRTLDRILELELTRLDRAQTETLAARIAGSTPEPAAAQRLWLESEGNPLFLVEAIRAGWEGSGALTRRVRAVLDSRLDQLSTAALGIAGLAAIVGRECGVGLLSSVSGLADDALADSLDELWRRRIFHETDSDAYDFTHGKLREAAAAALSPIAVRRLHLRIATALQQQQLLAERDGVDAQIGWHLEWGGRPADAFDWYLRAADQALQLYASDEAVSLLYRARSALHAQPASAERNTRELDLLARLPAPLASVDGYAGPRVSEVHTAAIRLAAGSGVELGPSLLWSLAFDGLVREEFDQAAGFASQLQTRGEVERDELLVVQGACMLGFAAFWSGELSAAERALSLTVERYRPSQRAAHLTRFGQDPAVLAEARLANVYWLLGDGAEARRMRDVALAHAVRVDHPLTHATAHIFTGLLAIDMRQENRIRRSAATLAELRLEAPQVAIFTDAITGLVEVMDGNAGGLTRIAGAVDDARQQRPAPGMQAMLGRVRLAAAVAAGDPRAIRDSADDLLHRQQAAAVWAPEARRQLTDLAEP